MTKLYTTCPYCEEPAIDYTKLPGNRQVRKYRCGTTVLQCPGARDRYDRRCSQ